MTITPSSNIGGPSPSMGKSPLATVKKTPTGRPDLKPADQRTSDLAQAKKPLPPPISKPIPRTTSGGPRKSVALDTAIRIGGYFAPLLTQMNPSGPRKRKQRAASSVQKRQPSVPPTPAKLPAVRVKPIKSTGARPSLLSRLASRVSTIAILALTILASSSILQSPELQRTASSHGTSFVPSLGISPTLPPLNGHILMDITHPGTGDPLEETQNILPIINPAPSVALAKEENQPSSDTKVEELRLAFEKKMSLVQSTGKRKIRYEMVPGHIMYQDGSIYKGGISLGKPYGDGALYDSEGNLLLKGRWEEGTLQDGYGTVILDNSSLYTGPIMDGRPTGKGIKQSAMGKEDYVVNGYGTLKLENGETFVGDIEGGHPSGYGEVRSKEGRIKREGIFHGGTLTQEIRTVTLSQMETFRGEVDKTGKPHGYGVVVSEKGMFFGNFENGKLVGDHPKEKRTEMLLFTSYTSDRSFNKEVIRNQKAYADMNGYHYVEFKENLAKNLETAATKKKGTALPYWSKIAGMLRLLSLLDPQKFPEKYQSAIPKEFVWLDDDAVVTNSLVKMEDVVEFNAPKNSDIHIFLTQDSLHKIGFKLNTALLFARNSKPSRLVFSEIWNRRFKATKEGTYGTCPNQSCLHEQQALQDLMEFDSSEASKYVRIIPQRDPYDPGDGWGINTFHRASHYDTERDSFLNYKRDPVETKWRKGDFIGQATGMAKKGWLEGSSGGSSSNLRSLYLVELIGILDQEILQYYVKEMVKDFNEGQIKASFFDTLLNENIDKASDFLSLLIQVSDRTLRENPAFVQFCNRAFRKVMAKDRFKALNFAYSFYTGRTSLGQDLSAAGIILATAIALIKGKKSKKHSDLPFNIAYAHGKVLDVLVNSINDKNQHEVIFRELAQIPPQNFAKITKSCIKTIKGMPSYKGTKKVEVVKTILDLYKGMDKAADRHQVETLLSSLPKVNRLGMAKELVRVPANQRGPLAKRLQSGLS